MSLLVIAVVLALSPTLNVILKLGLLNISKRIRGCHFLKHLQPTVTCFDSYNSLWLEIIDKANCKFDLTIKEASHVNWRKPNLNVKQNRLSPTLSL